VESNLPHPNLARILPSYKTLLEQQRKFVVHGWCKAYYNHEGICKCHNVL
jgi:hypothetical protein